MQIEIQQIAPVFLEQEKISGSEIWNQLIAFQKGEYVQLIAPSGSGKTSFIHFLYGLRKDFSGNIFFNNKSLKTISSTQLSSIRAAKLSVVFQDLRLFTNHTAYENIFVKHQLQPFHPKNKIEEMAERLGIQNKLQQAAGKCSYGEQQRIAIIRALQQPFDFIVLDEPFSHLDEDNSKKAMQLIEEETQKRNAGIILADLEQVSFFNAQKILNL
ncbi:MAG TPA: ATP-binding cassette domain-containing protein [Ferruginibacter sp.]|nr:ATP-binding cassette domain-containing protein [Ferruginibacter sp.]HRE63075.1 ATP-binding cassette domain-containing protein [Ferruginibacter sp.]